MGKFGGQLGEIFAFIQAVDHLFGFVFGFHQDVARPDFFFFFGHVGGESFEDFLRSKPLRI